MRVTADRVSLDGPHGRLLAPTSFTATGGDLALVHGNPGTGLTAFGLALAGRLRPSTGTVTVDGAADPAKLRRMTALVDVPDVTEPDGALPVRVIVGEELALAHRPANREAVTRWLTEHGVAPYADVRFENLEPAVRIRLLTTLAAGRPGIELLVLDTPDRHSSDIDGWWAPAHEQAAHGIAVVVLTATVPPSALPATPALLGQSEQPEPTHCAPEPDPDTDEQVATGPGTRVLDTENSEGATE